MGKLGRPPKYKSKEQARKERNRQHNTYTKETYEKLQEHVPKGTIQRLKDASEKEGITKRKYVLSAIEERLEKTNRKPSNE